MENPAREKVRRGAWALLLVSLAATAAGIAAAAWDRVGTCGAVVMTEIGPRHIPCPEHAIGSLPAGLALVFVGALLGGTCVVTLLAVDQPRRVAARGLLTLGIAVAVVGFAVFPLQNYATGTWVDATRTLRETFRETHLFAYGSWVFSAVAILSSALIARRRPRERP